MSPFVMGVSNDLMEECRATMIHKKMELSHLTVHAQQVEQSSLNRKNRDAKRARPYDGGTYKGNVWNPS